MLNICIPALSTNGWWFKPQGLETIIVSTAFGHFQAPLLKPARVLCVARRRGSGVFRRTGDEEGNLMLGLRCGKLHEKSNTTKGVCVCCLELLEDFRCWTLRCFFAKKRCGTLKTWVISYKGLTISHQFRIWVCAKYCWRHNPDDLRWK